MSALLGWAAVLLGALCGVLVIGGLFALTRLGNRPAWGPVAAASLFWIIVDVSAVLAPGGPVPMASWIFLAVMSLGTWAYALLRISEASGDEPDLA